MTSSVLAPLADRLRDRIDVLTDERDDALEFAARLRERGGRRHCVYCGRGCYGLACGYHADLPDLDDFYAEKQTPPRPAQGSGRGGVTTTEV